MLELPQSYYLISQNMSKKIINIFVIIVIIILGVAQMEFVSIAQATQSDEMVNKYPIRDTNETVLLSYSDLSGTINDNQAVSNDDVAKKVGKVKSFINLVKKGFAKGLNYVAKSSTSIGEKIKKTKNKTTALVQNKMSGFFGSKKNKLNGKIKVNKDCIVVSANASLIKDKQVLTGSQLDVLGLDIKSTCGEDLYVTDIGFEIKYLDKIMKGFGALFMDQAVPYLYLKSNSATIGSVGKIDKMKIFGSGSVDWSFSSTTAPTILQNSTTSLALNEKYGIQLKPAGQAKGGPGRILKHSLNNLTLKGKTSGADYKIEFKDISNTIQIVSTKPVIDLPVQANWKSDSFLGTNLKLYVNEINGGNQASLFTFSVKAKNNVIDTSNDFLNLDTMDIELSTYGGNASVSNVRLYTPSSYGDKPYGKCASLGGNKWRCSFPTEHNYNKVSENQTIYFDLKADIGFNKTAVNPSIDCSVYLGALVDKKADIVWKENTDGEDISWVDNETIDLLNNKKMNEIVLRLKPYTNNYGNYDIIGPKVKSIEFVKKSTLPSQSYVFSTGDKIIINFNESIDPNSISLYSTTDQLVAGGKEVYISVSNITDHEVITPRIGNVQAISYYSQNSSPTPNFGQSNQANKLVIWGIGEILLVPTSYVPTQYNTFVDSFSTYVSLNAKSDKLTIRLDKLASAGVNPQSQAYKNFTSVYLIKDSNGNLLENKTFPIPTWSNKSGMKNVNSENIE
jgi:hypothetical protein